MIGRLRRMFGGGLPALDELVETATEFDPPPEAEPLASPPWWRFAAGATPLFGRDPGVERAVVFGAGAKARQTVAALRVSRAVTVVGVVHDVNRGLLHGRRIHPVARLDALRRRGATLLILAEDDIAPARRAAIEALALAAGLDMREAPDIIGAVLSGVAPVLRPIEAEDLLARPSTVLSEPVQAQAPGCGAVLVTGAGGSIGSALCRRLLALGVRRLVLYEISEFALYTIDAELRALRAAGGVPADCEIVPVLGSICDEARLSQVLAAYGARTVYHAAAYKHVPLVETNVLEGVRNNVLGTRSVVAAALHAGVRRLVLVSTDKAVRPTSVMGATKRVAELIVQDAQRRTGECVFSMVRFGNVLGSSGSVIPLFQSQVAAGGPVTVTHPEMTRYFMTIPEAASLVIQAGAIADGGEVFLLDMGEPVRILDLARRMIELSGRRPLMPGETGSGIPIIFTGIREGEKLYEELLIDDNVLPSGHPRIARAREACPSPERVRALLDRLAAAVAAGDAGAAVATLHGEVDGYVSSAHHTDPGHRAKPHAQERRA